MGSVPMSRSLSRRFAVLRYENARECRSVRDVRCCHQSNTPPLAPKTPDTPSEALHLAVRNGKLAEVNDSVTAGTPVDTRDALGSTPA